MDHSRLHKTSLKRLNAENRDGQKVRRRSLAQKEERNQLVQKQRGLSPVKETAGKSKLTRREMLENWRKQRAEQRKKDEKKRKPVFKTSANVKRDDFKFSLSRLEHEARLKAGPSRNTRARAGAVTRNVDKNQNIKKRSQMEDKTKKKPVEKRNAKNENKENRPLSQPQTKIRRNLKDDEADSSLKSNIVSNTEEHPVVDEKNDESFAPANFLFKAPIGLKKFQFSGVLPKSNDSFMFSKNEDAMNFHSSTPSTSHIAKKKKPPVMPMVFSSASCSSSEEQSEKGAEKKSSKSNCSDNDDTSSEVLVTSVNISSSDLAKDEKVEYFRNLITTETKNLTENCSKWEEIQSENAEIITEEVVGEIRTVIGQAQLLMAERFVQFNGLIDKYENPKPDHNPVTPMDLRGFWEMIYYQVEDVTKKFDSLTKLKENDWLQEEKKVRKTRGQKTTKTTKGSSAHCRAARKRIQEAREAMKTRMNAREEVVDNTEKKKTEDVKTQENKCIDEEGIMTRARRKNGSNVFFATPSKKRKTRFAIDYSDDDTKGTPVASQPRKRAMRKTPLPGLKPESSEDLSDCIEDAQASPSLKRHEEPFLEPVNNTSDEGQLQGVKLNFDEIESDEEDAAALMTTKSLVSSKTEVENDGNFGIDMKYLLPSVADSLDSPVDTNYSSPDRTAATSSNRRVLRSGRKSVQSISADPFSPLVKQPSSKERSLSRPNVAVVDDLISFSPAS